MEILKAPPEAMKERDAKIAASAMQNKKRLINKNPKDFDRAKLFGLKQVIFLGPGEPQFDPPVGQQ